jgi:agarase
MQLLQKQAATTGRSSALFAALLLGALAPAAPSGVISPPAAAAPRTPAALTPAALAPAADNIRTTVVRDDAGRFWFRLPSREPFLSIGINTVRPSAWNPTPGTRYYNALRDVFHDDRAAWNASVASILRDHGFNTIGAWSAPDAGGTPSDFLHTPVLYVAGFAQDRPLAALRPGFDEAVRRATAEALADYPDRSKLLGVFLDNEAAWFGKNGWARVANDTLLEAAFDLPPGDAARGAAVELLQRKYATPADLAKAWNVAIAPDATWNSLRGDALRAATNPAAGADRAAFTGLAAERFFDVATREVRALAPGVLILGVRFAGDAPDEVIRACGLTCDVMSLNHYSRKGAADPALLARFWLEGKKPIMITEFTYRAEENLSGNPNTGGAGRVVRTQGERAAKCASMLADLAERPEIIGAHWFEWADQSPQGRFDGENSNYGIVSIDHTPYTELLAAMKDANLAAVQRRRESTRQLPTSIPVPHVEIASGPSSSLPISLAKGWADQPIVWGAPDAKLVWSSDGGHLKLEYDAGQSWGVGIGLAAPESARAPVSGSRGFNYSGATEIVLDADCPSGLLINITLNEAVAGADAEVFLSAPTPAEGGRREYRFPLAKFLPNAHAGNQDGLSTIDLGAIERVGIQLQGVPRAGVVAVYDLRLQ